jgi:fumarate reductase flavoprotein subunit
MRCCRHCKVTEAPVAIVGAGACGLLAALRLHSLGVECVVIERDAHPSGSTALSSGFIPAAGTRQQKASGIEDTAEDFIADLHHKAAHRAPAFLVEAYARAAAPALDWLHQEHGFEFEVLDGFLYPGHRARRMHCLPERTGAALMARLLNALQSRGIALLTRSLVSQLCAPHELDGRAEHGNRGCAAVGGLIYQTPSGTHEGLKTAAVLLACNGYGGNADLVRRYIPEMASAVYAGHTGNDGSALHLTHSFGAATADLSAYQGHGSWAVPQGALISWALMMNGGIQVNVQGRRFHDETRGYSEAAMAVLAQPGGVAWNIIDTQGLALAREFPDFVEAERAGAVRSLSELDPAHCNAVLTTVADLKTVAGMPGAGKVAAFGRRFERSLRAPLYAIKVTGALFHTQGGLAIDAQARVLRETTAVGTGQDVIAGLWAAGGAARGVSGPSVEGYLSGNGLLSAVSGAWIAAHSIASKVVGSQED